MTFLRSDGISADRVNHWQTVAAIIVCALGVFIARPIIGVLMDLVGGWDRPWWLPEIVFQYTFRLFFEFFVSTAAGFAGLAGALALLKKANAPIVAYSVSTIYACLFFGLIGLIYWSGQTPNDLLGNSAQLLGTILGLCGAVVETATGGR
jgi:hypothetical protein